MNDPYEEEREEVRYVKRYNVASNLADRIAFHDDTKLWGADAARAYWQSEQNQSALDRSIAMYRTCDAALDELLDLFKNGQFATDDMNAITNGFCAGFHEGWNNEFQWHDEEND